MTAEEIFLIALEKKTAAERVAYLDGACGDDAALEMRSMHCLPRIRMQVISWNDRCSTEEAPRSTTYPSENKQVP